MPRKGYKNLTLKDKVAKRLDELAQRLGKSPPETLEYLLEKEGEPSE